MTEENTIEKLKYLAENIQLAKLGKRGKEAHVNSYIVIDEYHEWRTESEDLFSQFFDESNSQYSKFISLPRTGNGHVLMHYFNQQYPIFKLLINKIEKGEKMKIENPKESHESKEEKSIFISHATKDKDIVDAFVDVILQGGLSVPIDKIFCVSTDGTKIESGADWRDSINESLLSAKINFLIITPNYKESEVCMNEMGAAWVTSATVLPLIVDPINYKTVGIIQEPKQIEKLLDEKSLDRIKDIVQKSMEIPTELIRSDRWTAKKTEFLIRVEKHISANSFDVPMDRNAFDELIKQNTDLESTIKYLIAEKAELEGLISELKRAKDKQEVETIIKKRTPSTQFQEFLELTSIVNKLLANNSSIINGIIFKSYSGKEVTIQWEGNKEDIDEAFANDFIDEDLEVRWDTTTEMIKIKSALDKVEKFLSKRLKNDFFQSYEENFDAPMKLNNKKFWEEVFEISVSFS
ncbi:toll/interleukin-1 receptor domain-containing protein [uncultured Draconibacterium sp.]|uniref:toll/interleukin-1 receptor domain-containing protein n=1 Tax=uncultured Draconibacterium sp. TaxID=1573823 RepID=UPI0029C61AFE|nr:toll/interleukin-1 receptor domain-containing protein [uncultured Draconibacterium sp.]